MFMGGCGIYLILNKYIFKLKYHPDIFDNFKDRPKLILIIFAFLIGPTYDFLIFSYYSLTIENNYYNCEIMIQTIESSWYFRR